MFDFEKSITYQSETERFKTWIKLNQINLKIRPSWLCSDPCQYPLTPPLSSWSQQVSLSHSMSVAHNSSVWQVTHELTQLHLYGWGHTHTVTQILWHYLSSQQLPLSRSRSLAQSAQWHIQCITMYYINMSYIWQGLEVRAGVKFTIFTEKTHPETKKPAKLQSVWSEEPSPSLLQWSGQRARGDWYPLTTLMLLTQR